MKKQLTDNQSCVNINKSLNKATQNIEAWLSLVERYIRDVEVAGSNPVASIFFVQNPRIWFVLGFFLFSALYAKPGILCYNANEKK